MLLAKNNSISTGIRKHTLDRPVRVGQVSLKFMMVGILGALALLYLAQSTQSASRSYQLRALDEHRKSLETDRERLEIEAVRLQSLDSLQKEFPTTAPTPGQPVAWETVHDVTYVSPPAAVAVRQK